jgi:cell division protein FtsB
LQGKQGLLIALLVEIVQKLGVGPPGQLSSELIQARKKALQGWLGAACPYLAYRPVQLEQRLQEIFFQVSHRHNILDTCGSDELNFNPDSGLLRQRGVINLRRMNVDLGIWDKLTRVVVFLIFVAFLVGVGIWYLPLINQNERYRKQLLIQEARIEKAKEDGKQLHNSIESLSKDPKAVERMTRERMGYAKPGETVIRFEAPATNTVVTNTAAGKP